MCRWIAVVVVVRVRQLADARAQAGDEVVGYMRDDDWTRSPRSP